MAISFEIAKSLLEIPEEMIREKAAAIPGDNNFKKLLKAADIFKVAGATPIFLATPDGSAYTVSSEETFRKLLH